MSRFNNLEFSGETDEHLPEEQVVKDEHYYLAEATAAYERGDFEQGLRAFAKVLEHNPKNTAGWGGQVRMLNELGEFQEAKLWADKALEQFPQDPELLAAKAVALARTGDLKAALAFSDAAVEERGDSAYVWLARGDVLLAREEKRADYCFEKAIAREPNSWFWRWLISRTYYYYRQFTKALQHAQDAVALNAGQVAVWLQLGFCQQHLGLIAQAETAFAQAHQLDPHCSRANTALLELRQIGLLPRLRGWLRRLSAP